MSAVSGAGGVGVVNGVHTQSRARVMKWRHGESRTFMFHASDRVDNYSNMSVNVHITVDVEVWPVHVGGWPRVALDSGYDCRREISAYLWGCCSDGAFGLPYQLDMLRSHGLRATFFVDPMFSFALGLSPLQDIVSLIQAKGQRVELHLHPEWLTDPRCPTLPTFRGPMISDYPEDVQEHLIRVARDRLVEAGARQPSAFRAGSWGADMTTLRVLSRLGIGTDASLNAGYAESLRDIPGRELLQRPFSVNGVTEVPMTRFSDGITRGGRSLSLVGVSFAEMRHALERLYCEGLPEAVIVMHSNEFVKTERLWRARAPEPRRTIRRRFERLCCFLADHKDRYTTRFIANHGVPVAADLALGPPIKGSLLRTQVRLVEQLISRWY